MWNDKKPDRSKLQNLSNPKYRKMIVNLLIKERKQKKALDK